MEYLPITGGRKTNLFKEAAKQSGLRGKVNRGAAVKPQTELGVEICLLLNMRKPVKWLRKFTAKIWRRDGILI